MEPRLLVAYGLIAATVIVASVVAVVASRRRSARKRRLRGIKDQQHARDRGASDRGERSSRLVA